MSFSKTDIQDCIRNAAKASFLNEKEKNDLINEIEFRLKQYYFVYDAREKDNDHESWSNLADIMNKNKNNVNPTSVALVTSFMQTYKNVLACLVFGFASFWIYKMICERIEL